MVARRESKLFLAKAGQFLESGGNAAMSGLHDAAMLNAVHAAISAADAVTAALVGIRSADPDHQRVADLLEQVAGESTEIRNHVRQLRDLLARKNAVAYESRMTRVREATDGLRRAERLVEWAGQVVERAKL